MRQAVNQRQYSRIATMPQSIPERNARSNPLVINVCQGGACLWLDNPPPIDQHLTVHFQCDGQSHVLPSRIVWSRHTSSTTNRKNMPRSDGWLAGIAFAQDSNDDQIADISHDILRAKDTKISFLDRNDRSVDKQREPARVEETLGVTTLIEESMPSIMAATKDLVPVFAKHFSDVRLVCSRNSLEISASFRLPEQAEPSDPAVLHRHAHRSMQPEPSRFEEPESISVEEQDADIDERPATVVPPLAQTFSSRKRVRIAIAGLAVLMLGGSYFGVIHKSENSPGVTQSAAIQPATPAWGVSLDDALLEDWIEVKTRYDLPVGTLRSAIQIMQVNDKYPSAHDLHDLAKYPVQAGRAFSLLADSQSQSGATLDIRALKDDLESRLMAGARFPDEAPGGRYSSLQRELYNNVVVLGVIDLFYRRQADPAIREILAGLRGDEPQYQQKQGA
jgi:hypothetical protein